MGDAQLVCEHAYDLADPPPVSIADDGSAAACVPAHATHVERELLKNALVATIEKHVAQHGSNSDAWDEELPPVEIEVAASTISVKDAGGGAVATLELPTDGDRPEALPAAPDVQNTSFGRR